MAVNKVNFFGKTLTDLTNDTVTPKTLAKGATAHDKTGMKIEGEMSTEAVLYVSQTLTESQKAQARKNIGAENAETVGGYKIVVSSAEPTVDDPKIITIVI